MITVGRYMAPECFDAGLGPLSVTLALHFMSQCTADLFCLSHTHDLLTTLNFLRKTDVWRGAQPSELEQCHCMTIPVEHATLFDYGICRCVCLRSPGLPLAFS